MAKEPTAQFAYEGLDRVIHERARLSIMTSLMGKKEGLSFAELKQLCDLSDGNLSRHMQVLQETGFVDVKKGYEGRKPHTTCRMTARGNKAFLKYLDVLEQVVRDAGIKNVNGKLASD